MKIILSVIIPCYNDGELLLEAIESVEEYNKIYKKNCYEIIIINDGSTDSNTIKILKKLGENYRVINQKNKGPSAARNNGIKKAKGKYLLFLDSDNKIDPKYIEKGIEILDKNKEIGVVYSDLKLFEENSEGHIKKLQDFDFFSLLIENYIDTCAIIRKKAWNDVNGFDENLNKLAWEDWEFWISIAKKGWKFYHIQEPLFYYRDRKDSRNKVVKNKKVREKIVRYIIEKHLDIIYKKYNEFFIKKNNENVNLKNQNDTLKTENVNLINQIDTIKESISWKGITNIQKFIDSLLQKNSALYNKYMSGILKARKILNKENSEKEGPKKYRNLFLEKKEKALKNFKNEFTKFENPLVSIIIPIYNKFDFTFACLSSIHINTEIPYEVILIDNGSDDNTNKLIKKLKNIKIIRNKENLGFGEACNQGVKIARGKYILFLNNDTIVNENWLSPLIKTIENKELNCGVVGSRLIFPDGTLQEAGSKIFIDGSTKGYGRFENPDDPEYNYLREVDYCSGACFLIKKDLFNEVGGFDVSYFAYYEDVDLCMELKKKDYKIFYNPESIVFHYENATSGLEIAVKSHKKNRIKFFEKWKDFLRNSYKTNTKKVLYLDDRIPSPTSGSGYSRAYLFVNLLREIGCNITIFPLQDSIKYQETKELQNLGIEVFYGNLNFEKFSFNRKDFYDIVIISRPHNLEKSFEICKKFFKNSMIIYDAEALFSIRDILKNKIYGKNVSEKEAEDLVNKEINLFKNSDLVISVSENEKKEFIKRGFNNVFLVGYGTEVKNSDNNFEKRKDILFIGGYIVPGSPNEDAILFFIKEIFSLIKKELDCKLYIVGYNKSKEIDNLASNYSESIIVTGHVNDLKKFYDSCKLFIVPHRFSSGIPIKLYDAMANGVPCVISKLTAEQMNLKNENLCLIGKDKKDFAEKIIKLNNDKKLWIKLKKNSLEFIKSNGMEKMKSDLNKAIDFALKTKNKFIS